MRTIRPNSAQPSPKRKKTGPSARLYAGQWKSGRTKALIWILAGLLLLLQSYAPLHALSHLPDAFHTSAPHHQDEHPRAAGICLDCLALCGMDSPLVGASPPAVTEAASSPAPMAVFRATVETPRLPPRCRAPPAGTSRLS